MPRMFKCSFCSKEFPQGIGIMYVKSDGTIYYFCSGKCRKNMVKLGRKAKKLKWARKC